MVSRIGQEFHFLVMIHREGHLHLVHMVILSTQCIICLHIVFNKNLPPQHNEKAEGYHKHIEKSDHSEIPPHVKTEEKKDFDKKAACQAKLKNLEEQMKKREEKHKRDEGGKRDGKDDIHDAHLARARNDSEASDSSRRSATRGGPPRFLQTIPSQQDTSLVSPTGEGEFAVIIF